MEVYVLKKRILTDNTMYHVTSRTNNKAKIFERKPGKIIMMMVLKEAKEKFNFTVANFCIMPTHIHLLITPQKGNDLPKIMHWIKLHFTKRWNFFNRTSGHIWGTRYFARQITGLGDYLTVMDYIDKNPVKKKLVLCAGEWKESGSYHFKHDISEFVDYTNNNRIFYLEFSRHQLLIEKKR